MQILNAVDTLPPPTWALHIGMASDAGVRPENQDRITQFASPFGHVFALADGMGGHRGGAAASSLALARLPELLDATPHSKEPREVLAESIRELSRDIRAAGESGGEEFRGMGSTLALLLVRDAVEGPLALGAHVGDSRIYFLRGGRMFCLTRDHTVVERLISQGILNPEEAQRHPQAGVLTRALGCEPAPEPDVTDWKLLQPEDLFVLCSDGLSAYAPEQHIQQILTTEHDPQQAAGLLVRLALDAGSRDNVSVIVCRVTSGPPSSGNLEHNRHETALIRDGTT